MSGYVVCCLLCSVLLFGASHFVYSFCSFYCCVVLLLFVCCLLVVWCMCVVLFVLACFVFLVMCVCVSALYYCPLCGRLAWLEFV